jgi:biotin carboxyl carrier protein
MRRYTLQIGEREFVIEVQETAGDQFEVVVGGETYAVTLAGEEDLSRASITPAISAAPFAAAGPGTHPVAPAVAHRAAAPATPSAAPAARMRPAGGGAGMLNAPMPGVILEVNVKAGDAVERGQVLVVLEAMKMNNAIKAPRAATIAEVFVAAGQAVGHGEPLVRFGEG